ncbi:MAG TPA: carboxymuconolactone decarboxylase family protein [Gaiellales bacterium]|jgi:alkylhydroperoxidase/carboxymuconolactone decarboxylase family protein YurZ|nr:carboxymuconolactone decarboxylase family protein [Gaiellales bacterium]
MARARFHHAVGTAESTALRLAIRDRALIDSVLVDLERNLAVSALDERVHALVQLGALIATGACVSSFTATVEDALAAGATAEEIVGTVVAVMPLVGTARAVKAAPQIALALGYDVDEALEGP